MNIVPVILSGGSGTRLWPLSRQQYPKQFLSLTGEKTLLQETINRLDGLDNFSELIISCNQDHRFVVAEQCKQVNINPTILLEPISRNTAPAILAAAFQAQKVSEDAILIVLPSDHVIEDLDEFHKAINLAFKQAQQGKLVTFGIAPKAANTGYGYIESANNQDFGAHKVERFIEKPSSKTAKLLLDHDNIFWNSGMFVFQANTFIDELTKYSPDIVSPIRKAFNNSKIDLDFIRLEEASFRESPSNSIDYAVMQKSKNIVVIPLDAKWSDVGSWSSLYDLGSKDNNGNVINGDVIAVDTKNTYFHATHHMVTTFGVDNLIVVDTPDATLIANKDKTNEMKVFFDLLKLDDRYEGDSHRKVFRPWGWFDQIGIGEDFQVKRLFVNQGEKLSLQIHTKRTEHWVVVRGIATVIKEEDKIVLERGSSISIPTGTKHSLENNSGKPLEIIEIQIGSYLGEDDIIRYNDKYGRIDD